MDQVAPLRSRARRLRRAAAIAFALTFALFAEASMADTPFAHIVFFTLAEDTTDHRDQLVAACHEHLSGHDGVVYFSVGARAAEMDREVNDRAFDVALHVVFEDQAAHDTYQEHPRHLRFIREAGSLWSAVRVFDSRLVAAGTPSPQD